MSVTLSAFGDEIAADLDEQLALLNQLRIPGLELRAAWGVNVLKLTDDQARQVRARCDAAGIHVSCLGSPVGKSPLADPVALDEDRIRRLIDLGHVLGTRRIRVFSWYPANMDGNAHYDDHVAEVTTASPPSPPSPPAPTSPCCTRTSATSSAIRPPAASTSPRPSTAPTSASSGIPPTTSRSASCTACSTSTPRPPGSITSTSRTPAPTGPSSRQGRARVSCPSSWPP